MLTFSEQDRDKIAGHGATVELILRQIRRFQDGSVFSDLQRPCVVGDGLNVLSDQQQAASLQAFESALAAGRVTKFVPASGAGSRMFERLSAARTRFTPVTREQMKSVADQGDEEGQYGLAFFSNLRQYPFFEALSGVMGESALQQALDTGQYETILDFLLTEKGLNYPVLPKAMLPFHRYPDGVRTPIEEHLVEAVAYTRDRWEVARLHFTVSPEHFDAVSRHITSVRARYETCGCRIDVTLSVQKRSTDTIAVDLDNQPFRDKNGAMVFRAGGHGVLLENLNDLRGDIVFIKNIDNVVPDRLKEPVYLYKRILGGFLVSLQQQIHSCMARLDAGAADVTEARDFCRQTLLIQPPSAVLDASEEQQRVYFRRILDRPVRVCGMVKHTGEPGGGPFWVRAADGTVTVQIVESAQVNRQNDGQMALFSASTHFNPVDLVCGVRDNRGESFDLPAFSDPETGFISRKSLEGRPLKALECPGLWNGGMAYWNTVFVEIPGCSFSPVKTIDDLLRAGHQPGIDIK